MAEFYFVFNNTHWREVGSQVWNSDWALAQSVAARHDIVMANVDRSVKPDDDFFLHTNGAWIARTEFDTYEDTHTSKIGERTLAQVLTI